MKKRSGFTLVELLIALSLISIIIGIGTNMTIFSIKGHAITLDEFNIQSNIRAVTQKINRIVRDASATFLLHRNDDENLTPEWNYIMLNEGKTKLLEYVWDSEDNVHKRKEIFGGINTTNLELEFIKETPSDQDKLLKFILDVSYGGRKRTIETELDVKNALQVIDRSQLDKANTLAYRYDSRVDNASNAQAVVSMVLDQSGSMQYTLANGTPSRTNPSRLDRMKTEAVRLVETLAEKPNINISIVPFSSNANNPGNMLPANKNLSSLKAKINGLRAGGGTNTGDGIRRGYYQIREFNEKDDNKNKTNKNFLIILVDGVTTYASVNYVNNDTISFPSHRGNTYNYEGYDYKYDTTVTKKVYVDYGNDYNDGSYDYTKYGSGIYKRGQEESFESNSGERLYSGTAYKGDSYDVTDRGTLKRYYFDRYTSTGSGSNIKYTYYYRYYEFEYRRYQYRFTGVKPENYVTGNNNIINSRASENTYYADGRYAGNGSNLDEWGTAYVDIIGDMVRKYKEGTNESINVYVIGFSSVRADYGSLSDIAKATRGDNVYYEAGSSEALEEIFNSIQREITDALWHIGGPN